MAFEVTDRMDLARAGTSIEPNIVLEIDGVPTIYGAIIVKKVIQYGDAGLTYGGGQVYGGFNAVANQKALIDVKGGTSNAIKQSLNPDKGLSSSISSMQLALVDQDFNITNLISPGNVVTDVLGRKAKVWLGFDDTAFKDDYIILFRGIIDDIVAGAGLITLNLAHPDTKKKGQMFAEAETLLDGAINDSVTTITVDSTSAFLDPTITGPDGTIDNATIKHYVRIEDEVMRYETKTGTTFATITRGALSTSPAAHDDNSSVESFITFEGNAITLALKLMFSGKNGPYVSGKNVGNFVRISPTETVSNSIFFAGENVFQETGVVVGDFITTTGASNGANNVTLKIISSIVKTDLGSYLVIDGVTFVEEEDSAAVMDIRSQFDTLGEGLSMDGDQIDVAQHVEIRDTFISTFNYLFYITETIERGKEFIEQQLYNPAGAYSVPRKSQASVNMHTPPLPGTTIVQLNQSNVINPSKIKIRRTTGKNFHNTVSYKFDQRVLESDKFDTIIITTNATSLARIDVGVKSLNIVARGMRTSLNGVSLSSTANSRRLNKYKFAAEFLENVRVNFKTGFAVEIGDVLLLDFSSLKISDILSGTRSGESRLVQIDNKTLNIDGKVTLTLTDTNFDKDNRFGLMSPCSNIAVGTSTTVFEIEETGPNSPFGASEFKKWEDFEDVAVLIRNQDGSTSGTSVIDSINGNTITLKTALAFTPNNTMLMELDDYDNQLSNIKTYYAFMRDTDFADGGKQYLMI